MKIWYDPEADSLLLVLRNDPPIDAIEELGDISVMVRMRAGQRGVLERLYARVNCTRRDERHYTGEEILRRGMG